MSNLSTRIEELEKDGWEYVTNYNTGEHILDEALIKRVITELEGEESEVTIIKSIKDGKIKDYRKASDYTVNHR